MLSFVLAVLLILIFYRWYTTKRSDNVTFLLGKTAIVTGGNEGIGYRLVLLLASRGCKVIIADRANAEKSVENAKKTTKNNEIYSEYLDLSSFSSVREFAERIKSSEEKIDILINNAGVNVFTRFRTNDGLSSVMQINYLGPFLLTHCMLGLLKKAEQARVIFTGSVLALINNLSVENLTGGGIEYGNSKYCNILAAQEFGKKLRKYNITAYAVNPGMIKTRIFNYNQEHKLYTIVKHLSMWLFGNEPHVGAQSAFHVAASSELEGENGDYYFRCQPSMKPWKLGDQEFCDKIWHKTEEIVKLRPEEII